MCSSHLAILPLSLTHIHTHTHTCSEPALKHLEVHYPGVMSQHQQIFWDRTSYSPLTHIHTHTHTCSEPALKHLQVHYPGVMSQHQQIFWDRTSYSQEAVSCLTGEGMDTQSPIWTFTHSAIHGQLAFTYTSLVYTRWPLM